MYINEYTDVPYEAVLYLSGECNYGGRVTDDWDRRCLNTILTNFVNPSVVMEPRYLFSTDNKCYGLPIGYEYGEFIKLIQVRHSDVFNESKDMIFDKIWYYSEGYTTAYHMVLL